MSEENRAIIATLLRQTLDGSQLSDASETLSKLLEDISFAEAGIDSLDLVEFFLRVEGQYGIKIAQDEYERLRSLSDIVRFIDERDVAANRDDIQSGSGRELS